MRITAFILLAMLVSCTSIKSSKQQVKNINFKELVNETQGGFDTAKFLVIKEKQGTLDVYNQVNKIRKPSFDIPKIDYKNQYLLALFMGVKSTGGYGISVNHIHESPNKITVFIKEQTPEGMTTMVITSPFCFVLMDKSDKEIVFEKMK